ncbi:MAG: hypothetical protein CME19_06255 [Gemmatimonadetes bacterium]|nr:hypothetical protein [Gemmatimonadota bacterium]
MKRLSNLRAPGWRILIGLALTIGIMGPAGAQIGPISSGPSFVPTDLSKVPMNRPTLQQRYLNNQEQFFPSLLGLRGGGIRAIRTQHFFIYNIGAPNTARRIAEIADEKLEALVRFYPGFMERYKPIHVLVLDGSDTQGNAFAIPQYNYIQFWASPFDITERGTADWVDNVFTHELAHVITHKAAHKSWPFRLGFLSTSASNDNPDYNFSLPLYNAVMPSWYSEGVAQYEATLQGDETWDTHRDMLLRMATLEDDLLSLDAMNIFYKDGHHWEMVYNQGFGLLNYVGQTYGENTVREFADKRPIVSFKSAIKQTLGVSANKLYDDWKAHLHDKYKAVQRDVKASGEREGVLVFDGGAFDFHPSISPDGSTVAFISDHGADYALTELTLLDTATRKIKRHGGNSKYSKYLSSRISWSHDSKQLFYVKSQAGRWDLFQYDISSKSETRLTANLRGRDPVLSPDGEWIAFVGNKDGTNTLGLIRPDGTDKRFLTSHNNGTLIYGPKWSPDGSKLLFTIFDGEDRDIATISAHATPEPTKRERYMMKKAKQDREAASEEEDEDEDVEEEEAEGAEKNEGLQASALSNLRASHETDGDADHGHDTDSVEDEESDEEEKLEEVYPDSVAYANDAEFTAIVATPADERDAIWLPDGSGIVYSSDRTGVFNIYTRDLETGEERQITNVVGGAFVPTISPDGSTLTYAGFHAANYSIYEIPVANGVAASAPENLVRNYRSLYDGPELSDLYTSGVVGSQIHSFGFVPFAILGPTFIGNRFGLDQISAGAQASWGQILGNDALTAWATVGKNFRRGVDLNSEFAAFYQTSLASIQNEEGALTPSLVIGGSRSTINSLVDLGTLVTVVDTIGPQTIQVTIDSQTVLVPNVTIFDNRTLTEEDEFKDVFSDFLIGTQFGIGRSQRIGLWYNYRHYKESLSGVQTLIDSTRFFQTTDAGAFNEITADIGVENPSSDIVLDDFFYQDLRFFKSHELTANWSYFSLKPTFDQFLNPTGGRVVSFSYSRINATVTDSLSITADLNQDSIPDPTMAEVSPTLFRADNKKLGINEYVFSWNEFVDFPRRTTLSFQGFVGYKDKVIKEAVQDGGTFEGAFYYPLRYYLGGIGTLRGYPYFSLSGGKVVFGRLNFTFPIFNRGGKELAPFMFDKLYGSLFVETGATGNAAKLTDVDWSTKPFLTDWGVELRMQMFSNYQIPMYGFFQIAFPTETTIPDRNNPGQMMEVDNFRIYFGLTI